MPQRESGDVVSRRLDGTALILAAWTLSGGCGAYDYHLSPPDSSGTGGAAHAGESSAGNSADGGVPSAGGHVAGGSESGSTASAGVGGVEHGGAANEGGAAAEGGAGMVSGTGGVGGSAGSAGVVGPTGWASVSECGPRGTTGGDAGPTVRPSTAQELDDAVRASGPAIIEISGTIELGDVVPPISSDKTLIGIDEAELIGSVRVLDARNVILKNIRFNGGGVPGDRDAVEVDGSACVWVDHCEFLDGPDSNLDIVRGSDLVTVSWSKFHYVVKNDDHRLGSVCGNNDADTPGRINVTFHNNWWAERLLKEMPGARHGQVHIFNNYFSSAGNDYCIAARHMSKLLVENNFFEGVNNPIIFELDQDTAEVVETGNVYSGTSGDPVSRGTSFVPPYPYALEDAEAARVRIAAEAGVR